MDKKIIEYNQTNNSFDKIVISDIINNIDKDKKILIINTNININFWNSINKNILFIENNSNSNINSNNIYFYDFGVVNKKNNFLLSVEELEKFQIPKFIADQGTYDIILIENIDNILPIYWCAKYLSKNNTIIYINNTTNKIIYYGINKFLSNSKITVLETTKYSIKLILKKCCFYTAIIGDNNKMIDIPKLFTKLYGWDYYLFTNIDKKEFNTSWNIININKEYSCNKLTAKFIKWKKHEILKEYDIIIWIDGYLIPNIINSYYFPIYIKMLDNYSILFSKHPYIDCIYDECNNIIKYKRDSIENVNKNRIVFMNENMPKKIGIPNSNVIIFDNKNEELHILCSQIFDFMIDKSFRDQISISYILWKNNYKKYRIINKLNENLTIKNGKHYT
jgi:hypothetical protein